MYTKIKIYNLAHFELNVLKKGVKYLSLLNVLQSLANLEFRCRFRFYI